MSQPKTAEVPTKCLNGINVGQLVDTIAAIEKNPSLGKFQFRAKHEWINGTHARSSVKDFYGAGREDTSRDKALTFDHDEPPVILGENLGVNPVEYAMAAAAGCVTTTFVVNAAARGIKLNSVRVELEGELDLRGILNLSDKVRNGYEQIRMKFYVDSDAPADEIDELLHYAKNRSPVFDIVTNPVPVLVELAR